MAPSRSIIRCRQEKPIKSSSKLLSDTDAKILIVSLSLCLGQSPTKILVKPLIQTDIPSICSWSYADRAQDYQQRRVQASLKQKLEKNYKKINGTSSSRRSQDHQKNHAKFDKKRKDWKEKKIMYAAEVVTTVISISPLPHLDDKHANTTTNIDHAFTCADQA